LTPLMGHTTSEVISLYLIEPWNKAMGFHAVKSNFCCSRDHLFVWI